MSMCFNFFMAFLVIKTLRKLVTPDDFVRACFCNCSCKKSQCTWMLEQRVLFALSTSLGHNLSYTFSLCTMFHHWQYTSWRHFINFQLNYKILSDVEKIFSQLLQYKWLYCRKYFIPGKIPWNLNFSKNKMWFWLIPKG